MKIPETTFFNVPSQTGRASFQADRLPDASRMNGAQHLPDIVSAAIKIRRDFEAADVSNATNELHDSDTERLYNQKDGYLNRQKRDAIYTKNGEFTLEESNRLRRLKIDDIARKYHLNTEQLKQFKSNANRLGTAYNGTLHRHLYQQNLDYQNEVLTTQQTNNVRALSLAGTEEDYTRAKEDIRGTAFRMQRLHGMSDEKRDMEVRRLTTAANSARVNQLIADGDNKGAAQWLKDYGTDIEDAERQKLEKAVKDSIEVDEAIAEARILGSSASGKIPAGRALNMSATPPKGTPAGGALGIRNNNPGNLVMAGQPGARKGEGGFAAFDTPRAGLEAMAKDIKAKFNAGATTVSQIVATWAPESDSRNNTGQYIADVSAALGIKPDGKLDLNDAAMMKKLMNAMIARENGYVPYADADMARASAAGVRTTAKSRVPIRDYGGTASLSPAQAAARFEEKYRNNPKALAAAKHTYDTQQALLREQTLQMTHTHMASLFRLIDQGATIKDVQNYIDSNDLSEANAKRAMDYFRHPGQQATNWSLYNSLLSSDRELAAASLDAMRDQFEPQHFRVLMEKQQDIRQGKAPEYAGKMLSEGLLRQSSKEAGLDWDRLDAKRQAEIRGYLYRREKEITAQKGKFTKEDEIALRKEAFQLVPVGQGWFGDPIFETYRARGSLTPEENVNYVLKQMGGVTEDNETKLYKWYFAGPENRDRRDTFEDRLKKQGKPVTNRNMLIAHYAYENKPARDLFDLQAREEVKHGRSD